jgi:hypothetical protein
MHKGYRIASKDFENCKSCQHNHVIKRIESHTQLTIFITTKVHNVANDTSQILHIKVDDLV